MFQNIFPQEQLTFVLDLFISIDDPQELQLNKPNNSLKASTTGSKSSLLNSSQRL
jgi:hypothetical protein